MTWQDIVLTLGSWVFIFALIPSVIGKDKPAFNTSLITGVTLLAFVFTYTSLSLWMTAFAQLIVAILWLVLAYQKYQAIKRGKKT